MTIAAKYASTCSVCHKPVAPGTKIEWIKGEPVRHATCTAAPRTYSQRVTTERKARGERRGMGAGHGTAASVPGYSSYCTDRPGCGCYDCQ